MKEMIILATVDNIAVVTDFVNEELDRLDCPEETRVQIDVAIDELFGNIAKYAYQPQEGPATVRIETEENPQRIILTFISHTYPHCVGSMRKQETFLNNKIRDVPFFICALRSVPHTVCFHTE